MAAMKHSRILLVGLLLVVIVNVVTFIKFLHRPSGPVPRAQLERLNHKLDLLQANVKEDLAEGERILHALRNGPPLMLPAERPANAEAEVAVKTPKKEDGVVVRLPAANVDVIPVVVMACNRVTVKTHVDQLLKYRPSKERFPVYVSQDCGHQETADVLRSYGDQITHLQHPNLSPIDSSKPTKFHGYYKIARHYRWALNQVFSHNYSAVIITEDDLNVAVDFFGYFAATLPIMKQDETILCVSAWNDNGKPETTIHDPTLLFRSDFFPGLGWMLTQKTWRELDAKWPDAFWDDWLRNPEQRRDRVCIRPDMPRTTTFGKIGVSQGQFFEQHLKYMTLNDKSVEWSERDLSYLIKAQYDADYLKKVYSAPAATVQELREGKLAPAPVRVEYVSKESFKSLSRELGLMDDLKAGVPRMAYMGIVTAGLNGRTFHLAPPASWKGYDPNWS